MGFRTKTFKTVSVSIKQFRRALICSTHRDSVTFFHDLIKISFPCRVQSKQYMYKHASSVLPRSIFRISLSNYHQTHKICYKATLSHTI